VPDLLYTAALAIGPGAMLGLLALGLVLVYRGTGVLNLSHASLAALGGYLYWDVGTERELPLVLAFVIAVLGAGIAGILIQLLVMRPLRGASPLTQLIATIGVLIVVQSSLLLVYGSTGRNVESMLPTGPVELWDGKSVGIDRLLLVVIAVVVTAALWALYKFTSFGIRTAAVAENPVAGAALGHSASKLAIGNWFLGGALAGLAGALLAPISGLDLVTMINLIVPALGAALAGGLISFPLTIVGALVIQIAQGITTASTDFRGAGTISTFVIVIVLMLVRGKAIPSRGFVGTRMPSLGTGHLRPTVIIGWLVAAMVLVWGVLPFEWVDSLLTSMMIGIVLLSIVVVTGYAGQLSLAQFALAGTGAVISAEIASRADLPFLLVLLIAGLGAVPIGILLALPATRMRGASLAVVTLAFNVLLFATVFSRTQTITVPSPTVLGIEVGSILYPERYLTLVIAVFALLAIAVANLRRGQNGRRFVAVRGNERAAASIGIDVNKAKVSAFAIAAFIAAIGGCLLAFRSTAVVYTNFDVLGSINQLAWTVIGGVGFLAGPFLGSGFAPGGLGTALADLIYDDQFAYLPLIGGVALILTMIANPDGIAAVIGHQLRSLVPKQLRRRPKKAPAVPSAPEQRREATEAARERIARGRVLRIEDVDMSFGAVHVLKNVSMTVEPGTVHGLIGPNGAGKTTLLDVVSGFVEPQAGRVSVGDTKLDKLPTWKRSKVGLGRSFQSLELFNDLTVFDNLRAASEIHSRGNILRDLIWPKKVPLSPAAWDAVRLLGLDEHLDRTIDSLSYGQRRLVAIARALATDSDVILLDEPAAGLDEVETAELRTVVRRMAEEHGMAVLLIEHDVELVMAVSDVVTALNFGDVIAVGRPQDVRHHPEVIASYLGTEPSEVTDGDLVSAIPELGGEEPTR
jgi:ABC-type branched-subunit amino acid transport system ATPase component/ABC-type branched-subunit amino acid transport system permease subunit